MHDNYLYRLATGKEQGLLAVLVEFFLLPISWIYGLGVKLLAFLRQVKPKRLKCRVISVGNITLGGSGKTSLVEYIACYLKENGQRPAVLSRGYKRKVTSYKSEVTSYETMGDEPYMLFQKLSGIPIIVDSDRIRAAERAMRDYATDTIILDDAFQQWQLRKDLEIVTIDSTSPFGNKKLIPAGILREPLSNLKRANIFVITKANLNPEIEGLRRFLRKVNPAAQVFVSAHQPINFYRQDNPQVLVEKEAFKNKAVAVFSGIGDPDSFEKLLENLGIKIGLSFRFPDHYHYKKEDLEKIMRAARQKGIEILVTTEKDAARLAPLPVYVLRIALKFLEDEEGFRNRLLGLYSF